MKRLLLLLALVLCACGVTTNAALAQTSVSASEQLFKITGDAATTRVGYWISAKSDVDGDGTIDIIVNYADENTHTDYALLFYGGEGMGDVVSAADADAVFQGAFGDGYDYGLVVADAGDVNNDGFDDMLFGDFHAAAVAGRTTLVYGSATRFTGDVILSSLSDSEADVFEGEALADYSGHALAGVGDVNNDGFDDFAIGAYWNNSKAGATYLFYGSASKHAGTTNLSAADAKFSGEATNNYSGDSIAGGDLNGDGFSDIIIGAMGYSTYTGRVYVIYGQSSPLPNANVSTAGTIITGEEQADGLGVTLYSADLNADSYDDLLIGSIEEDVTHIAVDAGAYIFYGGSAHITSGNASTADTKITIDGSDGTYYLALRSADVDGDGYGELILSIPSEAVSDTYIFRGSASQFDAALEATADAGVVITPDHATLGDSFDAVDVNGDGMQELFFGSSGDSDGGSNAGAVYVISLLVDADGDGVSGDDGALDGGDCDDSDGGISELQTYYVDGDGDGLGTTDNVSSLCSYTTPDGYVANSDDTNDEDFDNDGTSTSVDCDDADAAVGVEETYYEDADGDGLGNSDVSVTVCPADRPDGYSGNSADDDDTSLGDIVSVTVENGVVTVTFDSEYWYSVTPFGEGATVTTAISADSRRVVMTNGKVVRVYVEGVQTDHQRIYKKKATGKRKLKVASLRNGYENIVFVSSKKLAGRVAVLRLTDSNELKKLHKHTVTLTKKKPTKVKIKINQTKHRFTTKWIKGSIKTTATWQLLKKGNFTQL